MRTTPSRQGGRGRIGLGDDRFYTEEVNGQPAMDWVARLTAGEPVDDVRCTECTGG